jgi:ribosome maturation factor RimP
MTKLEKELEKIVEPVVNNLGYSLYDIEYVKEGKEWFLRLYIDNEKGIDLDDCEKVSNAVSDELDKVDPIESAYSLEVSSCGLERRLRERKHYEAAVQKRVEIGLFKALEKSKKIIGELECVNDDSIIVLDEEKNKKIEINFDNISNAKILFNWEE